MKKKCEIEKSEYEELWQNENRKYEERLAEGKERK